MNVLIIFLKILFIFLGFIFLLLLITIFSPCKYNLNIEVNDGKVIFYIEISMIFHLFKLMISMENSKCRIKLTVLGMHIPLEFSKKGSSDKNSKSLHKYKLNFLNGKFLISCMSYFKEVIALLKPKYIEVSGIYGLYDPAETGFMCGFISMFSQAVKEDYLHVNLEPDFENQVININANMYGELILFSVICKTLKFIRKDEVREVLIEKF